MPIELLAREQNRIDLAIIRLSKLEPSHTFQLRLERKQIRSSRTSCSSRHKPAFLLHFYILISFMQYLQPSMKAIQLPESTALSFFFLFWLRKSLPSGGRKELTYLRCPAHIRPLNCFSIGIGSYNWDGLLRWFLNTEDKSFVRLLVSAN